MGAQAAKHFVAFHQAVRNGNMEKVKEMIEQGIPLEDQDDVFGTPLHETISFGRFEICELLLEKRCDPNSKLQPKTNGDTPLSASCRRGKMNFVELLVKNNAQVNLASTNLMTPLHWALDGEYQDIARFLIENGANINAIDSQGMSPLHIACKKRCNAIAILLVEKNTTTKDLHDKSNMTPLMYACQSNDIVLMDFLLKNGAKPSYEGTKSNPLHVVETVEAAQLLLDAGALVSTKDEFMSTPLHKASERVNDFEIVELYVRAKADVNARDRLGSTPLHKAAAGGALRNVSFLLNNGATVNALDDSKSTPLHVASTTGYNAICQLLIQFNADEDLRNGRGLTPAQLALMADD